MLLPIFKSGPSDRRGRGWGLLNSDLRSGFTDGVNRHAGETRRSSSAWGEGDSISPATVGLHLVEAEEPHRKLVQCRKAGERQSSPTRGRVD